MAKAFLDTTILTNILLKPGEEEIAMKAALRRYDITELPVYAIKEFKAGPYTNFIWFYNKLALTKSFQKALKALHGSSLSPKKYRTATAIEALMAAVNKTAKLTGADMVDENGKSVELDKFVCDRYRLALRTLIDRAWRRRRQIASAVVIPLPCYKEVAPYEEKGVLICKPTTCDPQPECCLAANLRGRSEELKKLKRVIEKLPTKKENTRRAKALKEIARKRPMTEEMCRNLGDAFFVLFAPDDAAILTTNSQDHLPLAQVLGKTIDEP